MCSFAYQFLLIIFLTAALLPNTSPATEPLLIQIHGVSITLPKDSKIVSKESGAGYEGAHFESTWIETNGPLADIISFFDKTFLPSQGWSKTMLAWHRDRVTVGINSHRGSLPYAVRHLTSENKVQFYVSYSGEPSPCPPCENNQPVLPGCSGCPKTIK